MKWSQENCLSDNRHLTHEVWGGDYEKLPDTNPAAGKEESS